MMQILWKEWRQVRWFLLIGLAAGMAAPVLDLSANWISNGDPRTDAGEGVVGAFGAFFAICLAIATTGSDIRRGLANFWQSKPISPTRLFTVKFLLAVLALPLMFAIFQSLDIITFGKFIENEVPAAYQHNFPIVSNFAWNVWFYTSCIAVLLFAVSMLLMVLLRNSSKAVLLSLWAGLLVYFLPLLVPGMGWLNIFAQLENDREFYLPDLIRSTGRLPGDFAARWHQYWHQELSWNDDTIFLTFILAASFLAVVFTVVAIRRNWRWEAGQKTLVWLLGGSMALIFGIAMLQVGRNLDLQKVKNQTVEITNWTDGKILANVDRWSPERSYFINDNLIFSVEKSSNAAFDLQTTALILSVMQYHPEQGELRTLKKIQYAYDEITPDGNSWLENMGMYVRGNHLYLSYVTIKKYHSGERILNLLILDISNPGEPVKINQIAIEKPMAHWKGPMAGKGEYFYLIQDGHRLAVFSLSDPREPNIVREIECKGMAPLSQKLELAGNRLICWDSQPQFVIFDLADPVQPREIGFYRPEILKDSYQEMRLAAWGDYLYLADAKEMQVWQMQPEAERRFKLERMAVRRATGLERLAGGYPQQMFCRDNLLYAAEANLGLIVYDLSDPLRPRRIRQGGDYIYNLIPTEPILVYAPYGRSGYYAVPKIKK